MAITLTINFTEGADAYEVGYRLYGTSDPFLFISPSPTESPVIIEGLDPGIYEISVAIINGEEVCPPVIYVVELTVYDGKWIGEDPECLFDYGNDLLEDDFTRNNCPVNYSPAGPTTYSIPANTYFDETQIGADAQAAADMLANGQAYANANGTCVEDEHWFNVLYTEDFTRNNCGLGFYGSVVTYTVPANTYKSYVSQLDADNMAIADAAANGQAYANANGICTADGEYSNVYASDTFTKDDCSEGYHGSDVLYEVPAGTYTSLISQMDADAQAAADIAANGQDYANTNGTCIPNTYPYKWIVDPSSDYCEDDNTYAFKWIVDPSTVYCEDDEFLG